MGKLLVLSGGSKGIGKAIIERFVKEGFDVITCARHLDSLDSLKKELSQLYPNRQIHIVQADVGLKRDVEHFASEVQKLNQPVDVLVNNAGYFVPGQIHTEEDGVLENMMNTNLFSAYYLSRHFIPSMKKQEKGHIFNICSIASLIAYDNGGSYAITKFAMLGMSKVLREEMKPFGIRVSSILPGATYTASWEGVDIPNDRFMPAEDVAEMTWAAYSLSSRTVLEDMVLRPQLGDL